MSLYNIPLTIPILNFCLIEKKRLINNEKKIKRIQIEYKRRKINKQNLIKKNILNHNYYINKLRISKCIFQVIKIQNFIKKYINKKEKNGIYIWLDEPNDGDKNFDNTNLEAYVGRFEEGTYLKGTYLQKIEDDYHLYYGKFTKEGLKNDEGGFFYSSNLDRLFHGKIVNDVFVEGYITFFDSDEGKLESIVYANFDKDFNVTNIILEKDLQEDEKQEEGKLCSRFRDVILGIDYFGELYQKIKEITDFTENDMKNSEIFNDQEKFPSIIRLAVAYSKNNIDKDIYTKVFDH